MTDISPPVSTAALLADGGVGTMLHTRGVGFERYFGELHLGNLSAAAVHPESIEAGAQIVLTNTFGSNRFKLEQHGLAAKVDEINRAGVEPAWRASAGTLLGWVHP